MSPNLQASFWLRMALQDGDRDVCVRAIEEVYPSTRVEDHIEQGYCSFTLLVSPALVRRAMDQPKSADGDRSSMSSSPFIVQLRPPQHALDEDIARAAGSTYGGIAPDVRSLPCPLPGGLRAYEMSLKKGVPLSTLLSQKPSGTEVDRWHKQIRLVESLASFVGQAWPPFVGKAGPTRHIRADSPMLDDSSWLAQCTGKVGANIERKLGKLSRELPDSALRKRAKKTLEYFMAIEDHPVVLNHGDLIPTNILVDEETWEITGIIDWAEAEWLPFGLCLYGLDHLLGFLDRSSSTAVFRYREGADLLRETFWRKLTRKSPHMEARMKDVTVMRDVGVLLWLGYAWDEGKIDRVVNEVDDMEELARLRAFLYVQDCALA